MSVEPPGPPAAPKASVNAPRAGSGPKRPPRPERRAPAPTNGSGDTTNVAPERPSPFGSASAPAATAVAARGPAPAPPTAPTPVVAPPEPAESTTAGPTGRRRTRRGRRVKRVVRRIDLWSVLKLSLVVYTCLYIAVLATLAALWGILHQSGNIEKLQSFLEDVGLDNFTFYGNQMFRACAAIGAVGVLAGTVITVLATALVNVISEMTGGIRLIVIEEDVDR
ncbi:DUF3566 domain-containing protein [Aquihabitans daechungensis]|uniref:DUF3566 domain-containing protein n=1 Tax=Aquihabitans daechungensis TaxID=1052257 RepID=UPI003B9FB816